MLTLTKPMFAIFVDRVHNRWIVRDADGNYWIVPVVESGWEKRLPYELSEDAELEAVPGHYRYLLNLPF